MADYTPNFIKRLQGRDPEKEALQKKQAEDFENTTGKNANSDEEAGIEPDQYTEAMMDAATLNPADFLATTGKIIAGGAAKSALSKLKEQEPPTGKIVPQEVYRKRWNALSGAERDAHGNDFSTFLKSEVKNDRNLQEQAALSKQALRQDVRSNPSEGSDLSYEGQQASEPRRPMDISRKFDGIQKVADVESGAVSPSQSVSPKSEPVVQDVKFREYEGPSFQDTQKAKQKDALAEALMKRYKSRNQ